MNGNSIVNLAYTLTNTNSATFLDANETNIYAHLNTFYGHRILDILRVRVDVNATIEKSYQTFLNTTGLVEGENGYNGEYSFPVDLLRPTRVEVSYDGVTWRKATVYDNALNNHSEMTASSEEPSTLEPRVDFNRNSCFIRPLNITKDIPKGIYIEYEKRQTSFTSSEEPTDIEKNLHDILAYDLAELEIIQKTDKYTPQKIAMFNSAKNDKERRFLQFYKTNIPVKKVMTFKYV
ncbi:MAG: hypothetical protein EOL91_07985 [Actinobacteria bacterium]|nr:hypothetical protein [Actinomycetota bacterium]